jgi:uncharacterized protein
MYVEQSATGLQVAERRAVETAKTACRKGVIWIDLDNTPHVPFFKPIIRELEREGHSVLLTARDAFQVWELAQHLGVKCEKIGRHYGKNRLRKLFGLVFRTMQFVPTILRHRPKVALSHGSRSQLLAANLFRIPTIGLDDYEHSTYLPLAHPKWLIVPESIATGAVSQFSNQVRHYSGLKEDVYASDFVPDASILEQLQLDPGGIIVTIRPPANEAHYHHSDSDTLFDHLMNRVCATPGLKTVLLPRNKQQGCDIRRRHPEWFADNKVTIPGFAVDGLNLVWHSDLVIGGGGTMNREAAALGVPVYSIFRGRTGAVDQQLERDGRLTLIRSVEEVDRKIEFKRRVKAPPNASTPRKALHDIMRHLEDILRECPGV